MTPAREGLLSTIRALMEMTEARGCTKAEAAIASAKARQLMEKHGISLKALALSAGITGAHASAEPRREPFQRTRSREYRGDAFVNEDFARKRRGWRRESFRNAGRALAGYAAVGFGIWAIAAFHITPYQQDHPPYKYGQGVSNGEEHIIGDGANPPTDKGQVSSGRSTLYEGDAKYFGGPQIRPIPED
jgi:hypothetical protein